MPCLMKPIAGRAEGVEATALCSPSYAKSLSLIGIWTLAIGVGILVSIDYDVRPSTPTISPRNWPQESKLTKSEGGLTLLMFVHPKCPCTRASLSELESVLRNNNGEVVAHVCFVKAAEQPPEWAHSDLWQIAAAIREVAVVCDGNGNESRLFNATTSGHTLVYDANGELIFSGGITAARGHFGPNQGSEALRSTLQQSRGGSASSPIFGCDLHSCRNTCCSEGKR